MIPIQIQTQPDDETCGPTSLHAVYRHYGDNISLDEVIKQVKKARNGGTLPAYLACHALDRNYRVTAYVYNINIFDPTWFDRRTHRTENKDLLKKLHQQKKYLTYRRDIEASNAYIKMLRKGGEIRFQDLNLTLLECLFAQKKPILTGLSATYLYQSPRERTNRKGESIYDDIRGDPCGHFVILCGIDDEGRNLVVADPHRTNPISKNNYYKVTRSRLINSIMLGVLTYDSNLLIISPKDKYEDYTCY
ncbi:MAG: C39 family peptidase [Legionellales bacterium]|nr:C39 family peptidase [Legionellales bacterium]